jgi:hypothetical protein
MGTQHLGYAILTNIEEVLEMVGILIFIHGLLLYMERTWGILRVRITS